MHGRSVWVINSMSTRDGPAIGTGLLHSVDGGGHFAVEPQPIPGIDCDYSPVSDSVVWSYCSGGHFMFAFVSTDGGAHFSPVRSGDTGRRPMATRTGRRWRPPHPRTRWRPATCQAVR